MPGLIHNGGVVCMVHVAHRLCNNRRFILMQAQASLGSMKGGRKV